MAREDLLKLPSRDNALVLTLAVRELREPFFDGRVDLCPHGRGHDDLGALQRPIVEFERRHPLGKNQQISHNPNRLTVCLTRLESDRPVRRSRPLPLIDCA